MKAHELTTTARASAKTTRVPAKTAQPSAKTARAYIKGAEVSFVCLAALPQALAQLISFAGFIFVDYTPRHRNTGFDRRDRNTAKTFS